MDTNQRAWYPAAWAALGAAAALAPALAMRGFTVDDALIPVRYAHHIATGVGYRFDAHGPSTDGVTPLPWAFVLAPFARGDALRTLSAARALGLLAWTAASAALAKRLFDRAPASLAPPAIAVLVVALAFPIGAWAASGLETPIATALATTAVLAFERPRRAALFAGLAAAFRPEMVAWAVAISVGAETRGAARAAPGAPPTTGVAVAALRGATLGAAPFVACAAIRLAAFGRAAPLSVMAKPSDLSHGAAYAFAASIAVLTPILALDPVAVWRAGHRARTIAFAFVLHAVAITLAGGDWMPYARLAVPVAPSLAIVFVDSWELARPWSRGARALAACALGAWLVVVAAPAGRHVARDREALVARARVALAGSHAIAALDVGWVSAAAPEDATIVDLAGLTDPVIAALPGGHTSKRVDTTMLLDRGVDTVLVYDAPRVVEERLLRDERFTSRFALSSTLPVGAHHYDVYRRR